MAQENGTDPLGILTKKPATPAESDGGGDPLGILKKKKEKSELPLASSKDSPGLSGLQQKLSEKNSESEPKYAEDLIFPITEAAKNLSAAQEKYNEALKLGKPGIGPTVTGAIQMEATKALEKAKAELQSLKSNQESLPSGETANLSDEERAERKSRDTFTKKMATESAAERTVFGEKQDAVSALLNTVQSGVVDQLPKEYYAQRLRMSKGSFGDLFDPRSDINAFGDKLPKGISREEFYQWSNSQPDKIRTATYDDRAKLFLTQRLGEQGYEDLKKKFAVENTAERIGFEQNIQEQNKEAAGKTVGIVQSLKDIHGAGDFLSFLGNMVGQAAYRAPISIVTGPTGSIVSESSAIYDRQLDLLAEKNGITREEVIRRGLDEPAAGQAMAVMAGTLDATSSLNMIGIFRKAITKELTESAVKQFAKGFIKAGLPEAGTEIVQGEMEEFGASQGAKVDYSPDAWRIATAGVGSFLGGGIVGAGSTHIQNTIQQQREQINPLDNESVEKASVAIEDAINSPDVGKITFDKPITQENAIQEPATKEVLQREQSTTGGPGSERGPLERGVEGQETAQENTDQGKAEEIKPIAEKVETSTGPESGKIEYKEPSETKPEANASQPTTTPTQPSIESDAPVEQPTGDTGHITTDQPPPGDADAVQTGSVALDTSEEEKLSGIKKALVPDKKIESTPIERRSTEEMLTRAKEQVDAGEVNPKAIVDEISQGNARALQPDEVAGLVYYKTQLDNTSDKLNDQLLSAIESGDVESQTALRSQLDVVNKEIDNYHTMSLKTAYEQSLAFRLRQMLLDNEYNLQSQVNKYKVANQGTITPEVEQRFKELDRQLKDANTKIRKLEESQSEQNASEAMKNVRHNLQRLRENRKKQAELRKDKINQFFNSKKKEIDPNQLNSITNVIGIEVWNGSLEAVRLAVVAGSDLTAAIQSGIDYVKEHYRGTDFDEEKFKSTIRPGLEQIIPDDPGPLVPEVREGKLFIPASAIKIYAEQAKDINELTDLIHEEIKDQIPGVTKREVRDAITRYGDTKTLSKEEVDVKLRGMKRTGRLLSSLEDVQNKKRPLRSGLQRDKLSNEERALQRQVKEGMKDIPVDPAEEAKAWKNTLDSIKSRLNNQISDLEKQIKTGEKTPKKKGIEYDVEAKQLQQKRDDLKKIIESIEGKPKMSDEQKIRQSVSATEKQINDLEQRIKNKDTSSKEKSTTPITQELSDLRKKRDDLKSAYQDMEKELGVTEKKRIESYKKSLKRATDHYEQRIKNKDFEKTKKSSPPSDAEIIKLKLERDKIKQQFDLEQEKARLKNRPLSEKIWDTVVDVWNVPKSLKSTLDMSAPFRQGAILSVGNPIQGASAFVEMFRQAFSEKRANEWLLLLRESPAYALIKQSKLYVAEPTTKLTAKEEAFLSNIADRIPIIGKTLNIKTKSGNIKIPGLGLIGGSNRAYTAYLNKLRVDVFANGADQLKQNGYTPEKNPEVFKSWANFINNASGRGNLGGAEMAAPLLNGAFFAPRYVASRFNLLNPFTYFKMPAPVAKMALKNMVAYIGFTVLFIGMLDAGFDDVEVEWDPRSSDFGKVRIGDTRFDPWAGFQQLVRVVAQFWSGERKSTKTGEITELSKDKFPYETRADVIENFVRSKMAPVPGSIWNLAEGENIVGEEANIKTEAISNVMPLYLYDMGEMYKEDGATGLATSAIPAFFGIGVQNYGTKSGLTNKEFDEGSEIQKLNKARKYSISQPSKANVSESLDHDIDDETFDKYLRLKEEKIKKMFDRYKRRIEKAEDVQIYDKLMDRIVIESDRHAKYEIARENKWSDVKDNFAPGDPFEWHDYKKNEDGKVVLKHQ